MSVESKWTQEQQISDFGRQRVSRGTATLRVDTMLHLYIQGSHTPIVFRPAHQLLIGRHHPTLPRPLNIDLTEYGAAEKGVSRIHAMIQMEGSQHLVLIDMSSSNGTYHNGIRLTPQQPVRLHDGDEIRFGQLAGYITFRSASASALRASAPTTFAQPMRIRITPAAPPAAKSPVAQPLSKLDRLHNVLEDLDSPAARPEARKISSAPLLPRRIDVLSQLNAHPAPSVSSASVSKADETPTESNMSRIDVLSQLGKARSRSEMPTESNRAVVSPSPRPTPAREMPAVRLEPKASAAETQNVLPARLEAPAPSAPAPAPKSQPETEARRTRVLRRLDR